MKIFNLFALSGVSLLAFATPAFAQAAAGSVDDGSSVSAAEIVVSARRREESLQDVPLVVNAVTAESIEKLNIREGSEVATLVPGLQLRTEPSGISASGQLRGVQYDINSSAGPTVAFYLNDAYVDAGPLLQALYDIGQIEVLRGPQGTLRGLATPSGSITFTTRKPNLSEAGASIQGTVNNIGLWNVNAALNIPIIEDVLGIRVAGLAQDSESNRVRSIDPDADVAKPYSHTRSGRVLATLQPTDWIKLEGMYQTSELEGRNYDQYASFSLVSPSAAASPVLIRPQDRLSIQETARTTKQSYEIFNWRGELRYGGQALIYQGSRYNLNFDGITNNDLANSINRRDFFQTTSTRSRQTTHEIRLQNEQRVAGLFDYVVGYYYTNSFAPTRLVLETPVLLPPALGGGVAAIAPTTITTDGALKEKSFYGNLTLHLGEATQISGGVRRVNQQIPPNFLNIGATRIPVAGAIDDKKWIYSASIQHKFTPDLMVYANTGTSRRYGPTLVNTAALITSPLMRSFIALAPEDSQSYEIGLKSSWLDGRVIFNISGFYQKFENYPYKLTTPIFYQGFNFVGATPVAAVSSSAQFGASVPVEVKGVEAELAWKVTPRFNLGVTASYADSKIKNGLIPCNDINGDGAPDATTAAPTLAQLQAAYGANFLGACRISQRSSVQSPFSATAQAEYVQPLSGAVDGFMRGLFSYNGSSKVEPTNAFDDIGGYGILNLYAGLRAPDGSWELNLYAKNVFDTVRATRFDPPAVTSYQELAPPTFATTVGRSVTSPYSIIQTNPPREFGVNLRFAIGSR